MQRFGRQLWQLLRNSTGLQQTVVLTGGNLFSTVFSAIALIILSRHFGPTRFSQFMVGYSLMVIITRFQGLGLNVALQKLAGRYFHEEGWQEKLSQLLREATRLNLILIVVSTIVGVLVSWPLARLLQFPNTWIVFGSFVFASVTMIFEYATTILQTLHRFVESVWVLLWQAIFKLGITIVVWLLHVDTVTGVFYLFYLMPLVAVMTVLRSLPKGVYLWPPVHHPVLEKQLLSIMRHSVVLMATAGIIDYVDIIFVQKYTTPFETGIYGGMMQLGLAVTLVGYSLAAVLNARVARYHHLADLNSYLKKSLGLVALAVGGLLVYLPLTKLSILITIGEQYLSALPHLPILMAAGFLFIATVPFAALFYSFDEPRYFSLSGIGQLVIAVGGGMMFIPQFGLAGAVWVKFATRLFLLIFTLAHAYYAYQQKRLNSLNSSKVPGKK